MELLEFALFTLIGLIALGVAGIILIPLIGLGADLALIGLMALRERLTGR